MQYRIFVLIGLLLGLAGCVSNPPTSVHQPMTAKPVERLVVAPADGAIFHAGINERHLFEDKRARNVGASRTRRAVQESRLPAADPMRLGYSRSRGVTDET